MWSLWVWEQDTEVGSAHGTEPQVLGKHQADLGRGEQLVLAVGPEAREGTLCSCPAQPDQHIVPTR